MDKAGYTDKTERAMFLAQMAHETGNFKYAEEIHDGSDYEGSKMLGNTEPGDGKRFKGRGYIQITGRWNYGHYGKKVGVDLIKNPELAADPKVAADVAIAYWEERVNREAARQGDVKRVTYDINGGYNGLADREAKFKKYIGNPNYSAPGSGLVASSVSPSSSSSASSVSSSPSSSSGSSVMSLIRKEVGGSSAPTMTASKPKPVVGQPVKRGGTSVQAVAQAQEAQQTALQGSSSSGGGTDVPSFSATAFRSGHKIKTLGITA